MIVVFPEIENLLPKIIVPEFDSLVPLHKNALPFNTIFPRFCHTLLSFFSSKQPIELKPNFNFPPPLNINTSFQLSNFYIFRTYNNGMKDTFPTKIVNIHSQRFNHR